MRARLWVFLAFGALAVRPAAAAGFAEARFFAGAREFAMESLDAAVATASGTVAGLGATRYSERRLSRQVVSVRGNLSRAFDQQTLGVRGFYYPRSGAAQAVGGALFGQRRSVDSDGDYEGTWGLTASWVRQQVRSYPTSPPRRDQEFGEGMLEFNSRQNYFDEFNFQLTAAYFYYDRPLGPIGEFRTTFLQSEVASLGTFAPVTEPPEWNVSLQYSRQMGPESGNSVLIGYSRIGLTSGGRSLNSYLIGVQAKLSEAVGVQAGYNAVKGTRDSTLNYFGATLAYYWR